MTLKEFKELTKDMSEDADIILEVMDSDAEPYSANVTAVFLNEIGEIVVSDDIFYLQ